MSSLLYPNIAIGNIDHLPYFYDGNKLIGVDDAVTTNNTGDFFDNGKYYQSLGIAEYTYDANGNLITDKNKGIISIVYNYHNLPVSVSKTATDRVEYLYDAAGNKLQQKYIVAGNLVKTTDFVGNFVYENGVLVYANTGEGRMVYKTDGTCFAEFSIKDHLGNVRATCWRDYGSGILKTRQVNSYYPFGMNIKGLSQNSTDVTSPNEYLYNGKMAQDEMGLNWLDYGARFYDPILGRFHSEDRFAEKYLNFTPYHYGADNPILYIDINGDSLHVAQNFLNDQNLQKVLSIIMSSSYGKEYLSKYAAKGDKFAIGNKTYSFDSEGEFSKKGINLNLDKMLPSDRYYSYYDGYASPSDKGKNIDVVIDARGDLFKTTETAVHEIFLEADYMAKDFGDNGMHDNSNISQSIKDQSNRKDYYGHFQNNYDRANSNNHSQMVWPGAAFHVLKLANTLINRSSPLSDQQIKEKMLSPVGLNGKILIK